MKTYCWKCEKHTKIAKPIESSRSRLLIRGNCEVCGISISRTVSKALTKEQLS